jgi:protein-tyrosine-phosphatase
MVDILALGDASSSELAEALDLQTNLVAHHVNVLAEAGLVERSRSEADRRRTYLRLCPEALARLVPAPQQVVPRVVFVCTHNSARSQLAAALWVQRSPIPAASAGTEPARRVHPRAVKTARRHGLTVDARRTAHVADVVAADDLVVAVCDNAHEHLTTQLGQVAGQPGGLLGRRLHWSVPDPAPIDTDAAFEASYTDIAARIDRLAPALTPRSTP